MSSCHVCAQGRLIKTPAFERLGRAASDCRPWPPGGALAVCDACATVQKPVDDAWRTEAEAIYADYDLYHQSPEGSEQSVFDQTSGAVSPRSRRILDGVHAIVPFSDTGRMLDVGCGTGAMLRAFSGLFTEWELYGADPNIKVPEAVTDIPGVKGVFSQPPREIDGSFDLMSIIHVLEHVENPIEFLSGLAEKLRPGGRILIEVPYFPDNPFDLLIADHCTHFTVSTLLCAIAGAGLEPIVVRTDIVDKEITALVTAPDQPVSSFPVDAPVDVGAHTQAAEQCVEWLVRVLTAATELAEDGEFGVFGTSISANWLFGEMEKQIRFFVDEDPARKGTTYRGRPVFDPAHAPAGANVYMVLPRGLSEDIVGRLSSCPAALCLPPEFTPVLNETSFPE